jgi:hypothetical protein
LIGTASPGNGGVGGAPVGQVHSGVWVPVVPRGGSPIFSTSTSPSNGGDPPAVHKKVKGQIVVNQKHGHSLLSNIDHKHTKLVVANKHPKGPKHN